MRQVSLDFGETFGGMDVVAGSQPYVYTVSTLDGEAGSVLHRSRVWDFKTGAVIGTFDAQSPNDARREPVFAAAAGRSRSLAVYGGWDQMLYVVDTNQMKEIGRTRAHEHGAIRSLALSSDDRFAVTGGEDASIRVWNLATMELAEIYEASDFGIVEHVEFVMNDRMLATIQNQHIRLWRRGDGQLVKDIVAPAYASSLAVSPDGRFLAVGSGETSQPSVWIYNAANLALAGQFDFADDAQDPFPNDVLSVAWSHDLCCVAASGLKSTKIYDFAQDKVINRIEGGMGYHIAFSDDDETLFMQTPFSLKQLRTGLDERKTHAARAAHSAVPVRGVALGGDDFACWLFPDRVHCWGDNYAGQIDVPALKNPRQVAVGAWYTCALTDDGIKCWGDDDYRQLHPPEDAGAKAIALGDKHACALYDGRVRCWGFRNGGRTIVPDLDKPTALAVGADHACAVDATGAKCWGVSEHGEVPPPEALAGATLVAAGRQMTCAAIAGQAQCWGYLREWFDIPTLNRPYLLAAGGTYNCAADADGVQCWGTYKNSSPHLADPPPGLTDLKGLWTKGAVACALTAAGEVKCWGYSDKAGFSPPDPAQFSSFDLGGEGLCAVEAGKFRCWGLSGWVTIPQTVPDAYDLGESHLCALYAGAVKCWGANTMHQLDVPADLAGVRTLAAGLRHTCAATATGVTCWGDDRKGQSTPPAGLAGVTKLVLADDFSCAATGDQLKCWGDTEWHQPAIPALSGLKTLVAGKDHVCALDGTGMHCFGNNSGGQITEAPALAAPTAVAAGEDFTCAVDQGAVKCWENSAPKPTVAVPDPRLIAAQDRSFCALGGAGLHCWQAFAGHNAITFPALTGSGR